MIEVGGEIKANAFDNGEFKVYGKIGGSTLSPKDAATAAKERQSTAFGGSITLGYSSMKAAGVEGIRGFYGEGEVSAKFNMPAIKESQPSPLVHFR